MKITCPHCGVNYEVTEGECGTTADCIECGKSFVVGQKEMQQNKQESTAKTSASRQRIQVFNPPVPKSKPKIHLPVVKQTVQARCPHCGAEYEVERTECGRQAECDACGKPFMIRAMSQTRIGCWGMVKRYFSGKGRATRKEFWITEGIGILLLLPTLGIAGLGLLCVKCRRLQDLNRSQWWLAVPIISSAAANIFDKLSEQEGMPAFLTIVSAIFSLLVFLIYLGWVIVLGTLDGTPGDNDYGPDSKGRLGPGPHEKNSKIAIWILSAAPLVAAVLSILIGVVMPENIVQKSAEEQTDIQVQSSPAIQREDSSAPRKMETDADAREEVNQSNGIPSMQSKADTVTIYGVAIQRLPGDDFEKIEGEDGSELFCAELPEEDGFTPQVIINSIDLDFDTLPFTRRQMKRFTSRQIKEFIDGYAPSAVKSFKKEIREQGGDVDVKIMNRSGNAVTYLLEFGTHWSYQKHILDVRNGRLVFVSGNWKSIKDEERIKACVDSARLTGP